MSVKIDTLSVQVHSCSDCGKHVQGPNVPELCPYCGEATEWSTSTVAVAFGVRRAGESLATGRSGTAYL